jgi:hypothetical protein
MQEFHETQDEGKAEMKACLVIIFACSVLSITVVTEIAVWPNVNE